MNNQNKLATLCAALLCVASHTANAATVTSQIGDHDGFGAGIATGQRFDYRTVTGGEANGTDSWRYGDLNLTHTYSLAGLGPVTSALFEIVTGGQGWIGSTELWMDGILIGTLTDADDGTHNTAVFDSFDLMSYAHLLDGSNTFRIHPISSGDGYAVDFSRLTITTQEASPVPIPASLWLLGSGMVGLVGVARQCTYKITG